MKDIQIGQESGARDIAADFHCPRSHPTLNSIKSDRMALIGDASPECSCISRDQFLGRFGTPPNGGRGRVSSLGPGAISTWKWNSGPFGLPKWFLTLRAYVLRKSMYVWRISVGTRARDVSGIRGNQTEWNSQQTRCDTLEICLGNWMKSANILSWKRYQFFARTN